MSSAGTYRTYLCFSSSFGSRSRALSAPLATGWNAWSSRCGRIFTREHRRHGGLHVVCMRNGYITIWSVWYVSHESTCCTERNRARIPHKGRE